MKKNLLILTFLSIIPGYFYTGGVSSKSKKSNEKSYITWNDFDLKSQFKLLKMGVTKKKLEQSYLKHSYDWISFYVSRNGKNIKIVDSEPGKEFEKIGRIGYRSGKIQKYQVKDPVGIVSHSEIPSCYKDKYRGSYASLARPIFEDKESALEEIVQE